MSAKDLPLKNRPYIWNLSGCNETQTYNHLVRQWTRKHLAKLVKWLTCVVNTYLCGSLLSACFSHVTQAFLCESAPFNCISVNELVARNRCKIWNLSDSSGTGTHNHLFCKRTFHHLTILTKGIFKMVFPQNYK